MLVDYPFSLEYLMTIDSDLRSKATWLISEDGLWDIGIGLSMLGFGLTISLKHAIWYFGFVMLAYFLVVMTGKEVITSPRMANWVIEDNQLLKLAMWIKFGFAAILVGLIFGAITFWFLDISTVIDWLPAYGVKLLCLVMSVFLLILGYLTQNGFRYYFYAGLSILGFVIFELFDIRIIYFVYLSAILLIVFGSGTLIRFLSRYPKQNPQKDLQM
jgi:uncharacterized membrane protein YfcA